MNNTVPKTISEKEKEILAFWEENKIFEKSLAMPASKQATGNFSFYDGPPFATGLPHYGHILAGTIKDAIPRYQTMKGNIVRRVWGWDCHGLPIENLIEKKLGLTSKKDIEDFGIDTFNRNAHESVLQYEEQWRKIIPRLGRWVDMDHPYKTMDSTYTESIWWAWKILYEKNLAYEGSKMMHICPRCETTLAQSEVGMNYEDVTDLSVTAMFELVDPTSPEDSVGHVSQKTYILAWTTTPWTLPGNSALAVHKDVVYLKIKKSIMSGTGIVNQGHKYPDDFLSHYIVSKHIFEKEAVLISSSDGIKNKIYKYKQEDCAFEIIEEFTGEKLIGKSYKPVFPYFENLDIENKENAFKIWHADFITEDSGTGIAHEAPAFGAEDMELAKEHNIPVFKHVKMDGTFTQVVTDFDGMKVKVAGDTQSADIAIIKWLAHHGKLFEKHKIIHSYPLCWRCKTPLLNYATSSWFVDVPKLKTKLLSENQKIGWTPSHTRDGRFGKWLEGAREWAVSRTRYWGAPLPVWKNADGSEIKVIGSLKELAENSLTQPKNTYYVMRHGEAKSNVEGFMDKGTDTNNHLTEKGKEQVRAAADALKDAHIDIIISSPVLRGKETAEIVANTVGCTVIFDDRLKENDMGIYDGKTREEYFASFETSFVTYDTRPSGGETHREMMNRTMAAIGDFEQSYEGKTILLVTHGGPARMLFAGASLLTEEEVVLDELQENGSSLYPKNAEVKVVRPLLVPRDTTGAVNLHRPYIDKVIMKDSKGEEMRRIGDVFDCWFESGSMPFASVHYPFENKKLFDKNYPAQFIAEGMDQTRGWFYSLINLGVGLFDTAPYQHVIVSGLVLASSGVKLSKSENNYTDPMELVEKFGADAVRYALLSSPVVKGENLQFDDENISDVYKKCISRLENVVTLYEMNNEEHIVPSTSSDNVLDMWIIARIHELVRDSTQGYDSYMLDEATRGIGDIIDDISVWYIRRSRERLKGDMGAEEKKEAYETLSYILLALAKVMAPVMPFIAERVYKAVDGEKESVHLESWPEGGAIDEKLIVDMKLVRDAVSLGLMKRTEAKIGVKQPLLSITFKQVVDELFFGLITDELNVKEVRIDEGQEDEAVLDTTITEGLQKEGDMRKLIRAVQDARKEKGLQPSEAITLSVSSLALLSQDAQLRATCKITDITEDTSVITNPVELSFGTLCFELLKAKS